MIDKIWVYIECPAWSFLVNCGYWLFHIHQIKGALAEKKKIKARCRTLVAVRLELAMFEWKKDSLKDWTPWVITIINNNFRDDCDGAAVYGRWLLKNIGIKSKILHLRGKTGHDVCVTADKKWMVSNDTLADISGKDVLEYFNGKYKTII